MGTHSGYTYKGYVHHAHSLMGLVPTHHYGSGRIVTKGVEGGRWAVPVPYP
jgi:hypothetical protein